MKDTTSWVRRSSKFPTNNPIQVARSLVTPTTCILTKTHSLVLWGTRQLSYWAVTTMHRKSIRMVLTLVTIIMLNPWEIEDEDVDFDSIFIYLIHTPSAIKTSLCLHTNIQLFNTSFSAIHS